MVLSMLLVLHTFIDYKNICDRNGCFDVALKSYNSMERKVLNNPQNSNPRTFKLLSI